MTLEEKIKDYDMYLDESLGSDSRTQAMARAMFFSIDPDDISGEVERQPSIYAYISNLRARAAANKNQAKINERVVRAKERLAIKEMTSGEKKAPTVDDLSAMVEQSKAVIMAGAEFIKAQMDLDHLEADVEAARQKLESLKILSIDVRREKILKAGY